MIAYGYIYGPKPTGPSLRHPSRNPGSLLFGDGSCKRNFQGHIITHGAIVFQHETLKKYSLPTVKTAHVAELMALTRACVLAEGNTATVYTDIYANMLLDTAMMLAQFGNPMNS